MNGWHGKLKNSFDRGLYEKVLIVKTLPNLNYWFLLLRKERLNSFKSMQTHFDIKTNIN